MVSITGEVNAGKSSLSKFAFKKRSSTKVDEAGMTRDVIEAI